jgi:hypothetical protein
MGEKIVGSISGIPFNSKKQAITMNTEVTMGNYLYLDSGIMKNSRDGSGIFYLNREDGLKILNGDFNELKQQIIDKFKESEPSSEIEVVWIRVSWEGDARTSYPPYGFMFVGFRIECVIKNVRAGLEPLTIAVIIIGLAILIPVIVMSSVIAWSAYMIISGEIDPTKEPVKAIMTIGLLGVAIVVVLLIAGVKFSKSKHGVSVGK